MISVRLISAAKLRLYFKTYKHKGKKIGKNPHYTPPVAKHAATSGDKFIRLIDGDEFIEMWQEYYDKMSDEDKNMLPLKRISFLGNNE